MNIKSTKPLAVCLLLGGILSVQTAMAQKPLFELAYTQTRQVGLQHSASGATFKLQELYLQANFAKQQTALGTVIYGTEYIAQRFTLSGGNSSRNLHQWTLPITLVSTNADWTWVGTIAPSLNTDFESLDGDDFTTMAMIRALYKASHNNTWVVGAAVDRHFGDSQFYPLFGANYTPSAEWQLQLVLPRPTVQYRPNTQLYWYAQMRPAGNKWNVELSGLERSYNVTTEAIRGGIGAHIHLRGNGWMKFEAGREFNRELESINDNGTVIRLQAEDANYLMASFFYQI